MAEIVYDKKGGAHEINDFNDDYEGEKYGMWLFLFTELLLFGGIFLAFALYFSRYTDDFVAASGNMNIWLGGLNTVILLISACAMGLSLLAMKNNNIVQSKRYLATTIVLALVFIVIKYFEWKGEFAHGIWPDSPTLEAMSHGTNLYFGLYFTLTGLHGIHVIVAILVMMYTYKRVAKGSIHSKNYIWLENLTLYWDYVHLVWVFVFPLFYMLGFSIGGTH